MKLGKFLVCLFITLGHVSIYWVFGIPAGLGTLAAVICRSNIPLLLFSDYLYISSVVKRFQNAEAVLGNGAEAGGAAGHPTG